MGVEQWQGSSFVGEAHRWIDEQLAALETVRSGRIEQPHVYPWSTVMRVPTEEGPVWFKANDASLRHEADIVELLSCRHPEAVPPLLARDPERGWMLMSDAGENLRAVVPRERSLSRWLEVLELYARVQVGTADDVHHLLSVGVPDMRLATLPDQYDDLVAGLGVEQRFRDASGLVRDLADELAESGVPETLQHDDLHDGQVFVKDGRHLLLDWGDACVSHPFFTLSVTLQGVIAWGLDDVERSEDLGPYRDAYLAPYAERFGGDLVRATDVAMRLGWACRAVNGHVPGDERGTVTRLRMFLDGTPGD
jgi:hypothetical protein